MLFISLLGVDLSRAALPSLEYTQLFIERQLAYCGRHHALASKCGAVTIDEISNENWAWRSYPVPGDQCPPGGQITAIADNMEAMVTLIMSGHLGYLPQHFAAPYVERGLISVLNPNQFYYDAAFHLASPRKNAQNDITTAFMEDLRYVYLNPDWRNA